MLLLCPLPSLPNFLIRVPLDFYDVSPLLLFVLAIFDDVLHLLTAIFFFSFLALLLSLSFVQHFFFVVPQRLYFAILVLLTLLPSTPLISLSAAFPSLLFPARLFCRALLFHFTLGVCNRRGFCTSSARFGMCGCEYSIFSVL